MLIVCIFLFCALLLSPICIVCTFLHTLPVLVSSSDNAETRYICLSLWWLY
ncbi:hypothetical protein AGABI1DRAFT_116710 [Agaricus bisporus var. burnettii JB137-S8]|uniref:Uncharacterized protein n=1 Tax=Agaricus bisporus var. burnettii (strain JB137-S8 / ATCC MYA-4627 / FGSC 10392) TaxID=597362 RepID=K5XK10_AGABU|nr:uncharacterized protein AGABI1DRAFT_116710 [Agaricus bisporus var. burnettii JB137-S8]EKM74845.1 hypothetical protein AGABI1DRAFT_116710 [Agaricus bisporus var. burnettii JB137-S8]